MRFIRICALIVLAFGIVATGRGPLAAETRVALVVGESAYPSKPLATAANDAGLVAQTLQAAGFDVAGARDLEETALKQSFRDFLDKVAAAGPDTVAFVYFAGYGLQLEGENYLVPIDAKISRDSDIPMRALRVSDYLKPLVASGAKLSVVVLDAARPNPYQMAGQPIAGGLALYEPGANALLAFNAAPGTVAPDEPGPYGAYAHALAEMIRDGGAPLMTVFDKTRLRVADATKGAQIPWNSSRIETDFIFFQRTAEAPARADADAQRLDKPISALGPDDGYTAAIRRDTLQGYQEYVASYPTAPSAKRVRAVLAARREALTWRRTRVVDSSNSYWSYLRRYPKGPHAWDARRRLAQLSQALEPPARFEPIEYDYEPPPPEEIVYVERPIVVFDDPSWGFAPPPPPPVYFLPPPPPDFVVLPPPIVIVQPYVLPAPNYVPIPVWQRPPVHIAPPPDNFVYENVHNAIAVDPRENNVVVRNAQGQVLSTGALLGAGAGAAAVAGAVSAPHFIARRPTAVAPAIGVAAPGRTGVAPAGSQSIAPDGAVGVGIPPLRGAAPGVAPPPGQTGVAPAVPGDARPIVEGRPTLPGDGVRTPPAAGIKDLKQRPPIGAEPAVDGKPAPLPKGVSPPPTAIDGRDRAPPKAPAGGTVEAEPAATGKAIAPTPAPGSGAKDSGDHALPKPPAEGPSDISVGRGKPARRPTTTPQTDGPQENAAPKPRVEGAPERLPASHPRSERGGRREPAAPPENIGSPEGGPISPRPQAAPRPRRDTPKLDERRTIPRGADEGQESVPRRSNLRAREPIERLPQSMREGPPPRQREAPMMEPRMRGAPPQMQQRMREGPPPMQPRMREAPPMMDRGPPAGMMREPPQAPAMMRAPQPAPPRAMGPGGGGPGGGFGGGRAPRGGGADGGGE